VLFEGENDFMVCLRESFPLLQTRRLTRVSWPSSSSCQCHQYNFQLRNISHLWNIDMTSG
jgi:hypothetical protein